MRMIFEVAKVDRVVDVAIASMSPPANGDHHLERELLRFPAARIAWRPSTRSGANVELAAEALDQLASRATSPSVAATRAFSAASSLTATTDSPSAAGGMALTSTGPHSRCAQRARGRRERAAA
jgi:hypothetical protein